MKLFVLHIILNWNLYSCIFYFFFSAMQKARDPMLLKKRHNMSKKEKRKVKKNKLTFDEQMRHRAEYESKCMSLENDNRLLK